MKRILLSLFIMTTLVDVSGQALNFSELAKQRQSVRNYKEQPVARETLLQCLETTRLSPSANNAQPWRFVVVDEPGLKNQVASAVAAMGMNKFAKQAPVIIAVVIEKRDMGSAVAGSIQDKDYSFMDIGIAVNQFCLQATELGLSTCIVGWFNESEIKKLLNIPKGKRVPLVITVGYSDVPSHEKVRKPLEEIYKWNSY